MRRDARRASGAALIALATLALNGCGADDSASVGTSTTTSSSSGIGANEAVQQRAPSSAALPMPDASAPLAANPAGASDPITQNMQASLAADSQQVAPVMHYAPGDSAGTH